MKIRVIAFTLAFCLLVGLLLRQTIMDKVAGWTINRQFEEILHSKIQYQHLQMANGKVVIEKVRLLDDRQNDSVGYSVDVERIEVGYTPSWIKRHFDLDVKLINPNLSIAKLEANPIPSLPSIAHTSSKWFTFSGKITVENGTLELRTLAVDGVQSSKYKFNGEGTYKEKAQGLFELGSIDATDKGSVVVSYDQDEKQGKAAIKVSDLKAKGIAELVNYWCDSIDDSWKISKGYVNGTLLAVFPHGANPFVNGELTFKNMELIESKKGIVGSIPELHLMLNESDAAVIKNREKSFLGKVEIIRGASLSFIDPEGVRWDLKDVYGGIYIYPDRPSQVDLTALCRHGAKSSKLELQGTALLLGTNRPYADFKLQMKSQNEENVLLHFIAKQEENKSRNIEFNCANFSTDEYHVVQALFGPIFPFIQEINIKKGVLNGSLKLAVEDSKIHQVAINDLSADNLDVQILSLGIQVGFKNLSGRFEADLASQQVVETVDADINTYNGYVRLGDTKEKFWKFTDIQTMLKVRKGVVESSQVTAAFAGMKGELKLDLLSPDHIVQLFFNGNIDDVSQLLPDLYRARIKKGFNGHNVNLAANVVRKPGGMRIDGDFGILSPQKVIDHIYFGFDLEKVSSILWRKWQENHSQTDLHYQMALLGMQSLTPSIANPTSYMLRNWLEDEFGVYGLIVRNGWFKGGNLPLEKYIAPLLIKPGNNIALTGTTTLEGYFDSRLAILRYGAKNVVIDDNDDFRIEVESLGTYDNTGKLTSTAGVHYFNFKDLTHYGVMDIKMGSYLERNSGIRFDKISTHAVFEGQRIHFPDLKGYSDEMFFAGRADIDYSSPVEKEYDIEAHSQEVSGDVTALQKMLSGKDHMGLSSLPVKGKLHSPANGGYLKIAVSPKGNHSEAYIIGSFFEGSIKGENNPIFVDGLAFNFDYSLKSNTLSFHDVQGKITVGVDESANRYTLNARNTTLSNFPLTEVAFDIRLEDKIRDFIRIEGKGGLSSDPELGNLWQFQFDTDHTHFGEIKPNVINLTVNDRFETVAFRAEPTLQMANIVDDLQKFAKTGFFFISSQALDSLKDHRLTGEIQGKLLYDKYINTYSFSAVGRDCTWGDRHWQTCFLNGKKTNEKWSIEQLQVDEISLAADLIQETDSWKVNFLGVRFGTSTLIGLEGEYLTTKRLLKGEMKLLEVNLAKVSEFPLFQEMAQKWKPKGAIHATGSFSALLGDGKNPTVIQSDFLSSVADLQIGGMNFENNQNIQCHFDSTKGLEVAGIHTVIRDIDTVPTNIRLESGKIFYDIGTRETTLGDVKLSVPARHMRILAKVLHEQLPEKFTETAVESLSELKQNEELAISLSMRISPTYSSVKLGLADGSYHFLNEDHFIQNFKVDVDPYEVKLMTQYRYRDIDLWVVSKSASQNAVAGQLLIGVKPPEKLAEENLRPLIVYWEMDPVAGFIVKRAEGQILGMEVNLNQSDQVPQKGELALIGQVSLNGKTAAPLFAPAFQKLAANWDVGKGYELSGNFFFSRSQPGDLRFDGILVGKDFELKNYRFKTLYSNLRFSPKEISVDELKIVDAAGQLRIDRVEAYENASGVWGLNVPLVLVEDFRPSLLKSLDGRDQEAKPLTITRIELRDLRGDPEVTNSLKATGTLQFQNPSRKNLRNTLLAIPADLLARIGLDPDVMTPVTGTLFYDLEGGRFYFKEFRDVYSEGRISKFYLPQGLRSSMGFDGDLDMKVRMKQYNLLFKLAELFTISIKGNVGDPTYSLQKKVQSVDDKGDDMGEGSKEMEMDLRG